MENVLRILEAMSDINHLIFSLVSRLFIVQPSFNKFNEIENNLSFPLHGMKRTSERKKLYVNGNRMIGDIGRLDERCEYVWAKETVK